MMETTERPWRQIMEAALMRHPQAVVHNTIRLWKQLAPKLISIIGERGFNPLYARSVRLACIQYLWLAQETTTFADSNERFSALQERLQAQDIMRAGLASMALFNIFLNELASLIGEGLTTHLLRLTLSQQTFAIPSKDFPG
jgi:hypothetical protein